MLVFPCAANMQKLWVCRSRSKKANMTNDQPRQLCPFSFAFAVPEPDQVQRPGAGSTGKLRVGLPCAGSRCKLWSKVIDDCVFWECRDILLRILDAVSSEKE